MQMHQCLHKTPDRRRQHKISYFYEQLRNHPTDPYKYFECPVCIYILSYIKPTRDQQLPCIIINIPYRRLFIAREVYCEGP